MIGLEYILNLYNLQHIELAEKLGIKKQNINMWVKGRQNIPKKYLPILEELFGIDASYFGRELTEIDQLEIQKEKLEAFLAKIEPDVFRVKGFFKVEKEGWEKVDVVGKKRDYAPYEPQPKSQLVFISKIGIALIREIKEAWDGCVGLPMDLKN